VRAGWRPPVLRLYDAHESARHFGHWAEGDACFLLVLSEGPPALTAVETEACREICRSLQGTDTGEAPVEHWLQERNNVPSLTDLVARGFVVDTIEVTADWTHIAQLYHDVIAAVQEVESLLIVSGHSSHSYAQGTNIYFTFVAQPGEGGDPEAKYLECWKRAMDATVRAQGSISHHHGIGRLRRPWMRDEHGAGIEVMRAIKRALDPRGILNPGALLPDDV
jgi:alkyldihydroxyacetonephosphate synthase